MQFAGPGGFTARAVAAEAGVALAAVTYYFDSVEELLAASAAQVCDGWALAARDAAAQVRVRGRAAAAQAIIAAVLPAGGRDGVLTRYEQLLAAARVPPVAQALAGLRRALEDAIAAILAACHVRTPISADLVLCVVDGAVLGALSERKPDPREEVRGRLTELLRVANTH